MARKPGGAKQIDALVHDEATRRNIPTAEMESVAHRLEETDPLAPEHYPRAAAAGGGRDARARRANSSVPADRLERGAHHADGGAAPAAAGDRRRSTSVDAQLVWRGKDQQDWSDLVVQAPQLFVQEKVHPKAIIDDLKRRSGAPKDDAPDLFADFNGLDPEARTEFYQHEGHWTNRMILGDSLQVMASLAEREALRGKVQCIYFDPPYGIKFNSNWQVSTQSRDVKDGKQTDISREPEQVKAFRDTWKDGIHSYLTYLRDRLTVARELLTDSGSIFVQIGDENVHRVRAVMDEVFGEENFALIFFSKTREVSKFFDASGDYIIWYAKIARCKVRPILHSVQPARLKRRYGGGRQAYVVASKDELRNRNNRVECGAIMPSSIYSVVAVRTNTTSEFQFARTSVPRTPGYMAHDYDRNGSLGQGRIG